MVEDVVAPKGVALSEIEHPGSYRERPQGPTLLITCRWPWILPLFIFVGTPVVMLGMILAIGSQPNAKLGIAYGMTAACTLAAGIYFLYSFVNRTFYQLDDRALSVRHGPLPYPGAKSIPSESLQGVFVRHTVARSSKGNRDYYHLVLVVDGADVRFDTFVDSPDKPRFIAQVVRKRLGLAPHEDR